MSVVNNSVLIDGRAAEIIFQTVLMPWRQAHGERPVRPEVQEFLEDVRLAAQLSMSVRTAERTNLRTSADMAAGSSHDQISTADVADALGYSERHTRRFAADHGVMPAGRNRWRRADLATLLDAQHAA